MTDKELRKLSRKDLLELLIEQVRKNDDLQARLEEAEKQLQDRQIKMDQAGSIAEASLQLSGVFEAAQDACKRYIDNICRLSERQEALCAQLELRSKEKAEPLNHEVVEQGAEPGEQSAGTDAKAAAEQSWKEISEALELASVERAVLQDSAPAAETPETVESGTA